MEYKRLTDRSKTELLEECHNCPYCGIEYLYDCHIKVANRLAELEDKIENGMLIKLPCKVGDTVYFLSGKTIRAEVVKQIKYIIDNGRIDLLNSHIMTDDVYSKDYNFYRLIKLGKSLFLTEAEAKKKLEELKNG